MFVKSKIVGSIFWHTSHVNTFFVALKHVKLHIMVPPWRKYLLIRGYNCCCTDCINTCKVGMHLCG